MALLFAEDLSINTTGAEGDSTALPSHCCQLRDEERPCLILNLGVNEVIVEIKEKVETVTLPALIDAKEEAQIKQTKPPPTNDLNVSIITMEEEK